MEAYTRWEAKNVLDVEMPDQNDEEEMQISIDSPVTTTHNYPAPPTPPAPQVLPTNSLGKILTGAALAAGLIGIPAAGAIGYLLNKPVSHQNSSEDNTVDLGLQHLGDLSKKI